MAKSRSLAGEVSECFNLCLHQHNPVDSHQYSPPNPSEWGSMVHDLKYDKAGAAGIAGALLHTGVIGADIQLATYNAYNTISPGVSGNDRWRSFKTVAAFGVISSYKIALFPVLYPVTKIMDSVNK